MVLDNKCKICRRLGQKLFLKGERCLTPKCSMIKKPYPPGKKTKRRRRALSEYGRELREKQKLKNWYNLEEKQFKNYVKEVLKKRGKVEDASNFLIKILESRFDNIIYRIGFTSSRAQARQLISHSHFFVNNKPVNIPSYRLKKGDKISLRPSAFKSSFFQNLLPVLKKHQPPSWLEIKKPTGRSLEKLEGKVIGSPSLEEAAPPTEISAIFEYYSR